MRLTIEIPKLALACAAVLALGDAAAYGLDEPPVLGKRDLPVRVVKGFLVAKHGGDAGQVLQEVAALLPL